MSIINTIEELIYETKIAIENVQKLEKFERLAHIICSKNIYEELSCKGHITGYGLFNKYPIVYISRLSDGVEINYFKKFHMGGVTNYKTILLNKEKE